MNVILCTGVMRSGSTWAFNVLRVMAHLAAERLEYETWAGYLDREQLDDFLTANISVPRMVAVIKSHYTYPVTRAMIRVDQARNVCTIRDPRDCVASRITFKGESVDEAVGLVKASFRDAMGYCEGTLFVLYDNIMRDPAAEVRKVGKHINLDLVPEVCRTIAAETGIEAMRDIASNLAGRDTAVEAHGGLVDSITHLHDNHIHSGEIGRYKSDFDPDTQRSVSHALKEETRWFKAMRKELS